MNYQPLPDAEDRATANSLRTVLESSGESFERVGWRELAEGGWLHLLVEGGQSASAAIPRYLTTLEEWGRRICPGPIALTVGWTTPLLASVGAQAHLDAITHGCIVTATCEASGIGVGEPCMFVRDRDGRSLVSGRADLVPWLPDADRVVVAAVDVSGATQLVVVKTDIAEASVVADDTIDPGTTVGTLQLHEAEGEPLRVSATQLAAARAAYSLVLDAHAIGTAAELSRQTIAYVQARHQFGQAIGSFQAVKHKVADMLRVTEVARAMLWLAANRFAETPDRPPWEDIDASRVCAGDAARQTATDAIQCFGGMGFTWEQGLHFYYRRALVAGSLLGNVDAAAARLVEFGRTRLPGPA